MLAKYVVIRSVSGSSAPRLLLRSADGVLDLDGCCGWRNTAGEYIGADDDTDATDAYGGHRTGLCKYLAYYATGTPMQLVLALTRC